MSLEADFLIEQILIVLQRSEEAFVGYGLEIGGQFRRITQIAVGEIRLHALLLDVRHGESCGAESTAAGQEDLLRLRLAMRRTEE